MACIHTSALFPPQFLTWDWGLSPVLVTRSHKQVFDPISVTPKMAAGCAMVLSAFLMMPRMWMKKSWWLAKSSQPGHLAGSLLTTPRLVLTKPPSWGTTAPSDAPAVDGEGWSCRYPRAICRALPSSLPCSCWARVQAAHFSSLPTKKWFIFFFHFG